MPVDVLTETFIARPVAEVAAFASDPSRAPEGEGTRMTLRNRGEPTGFASFTAPMMSLAMRRANQKDLDKLKRVLEAT